MKNKLSKQKVAPKKSSPTERDREHFFVMYDDIEVIQNNLESLLTTQVDKYALIKHTNDVKEDGTLKEPHVHIYVRFLQPKSLSLARELMKVSEQNVVSEFVLSTIKSIRYLLHLDDCDKYQYPQSAVRSNFNVEKYFGANRSTANSNLVQACLDMSNGVPMLELLSRYGIELIKNFSNVSKISTIIREQNSYGTYNNEFNYTDLETGEVDNIGILF